MNEKQTDQLLRELRIIRGCAVVSTVVFVLALAAHILRVQL